MATGATGGTDPAGGVASRGFDRRLPGRAAVVCARAEVVGGASVVDPGVREASGLVWSRRHPDVLWLVNDNGNAPRIIAVGADGGALGEWEVDGATNTDWEDLALLDGGPGGSDRLVIADLGSTGRSAGAAGALWVVDEPDPARDGRRPDGSGPTDSAPGRTAPARRVDLVASDGDHNFEALTIDPSLGTIVAVDRADHGGPSTVFTAPGSVLDTGTGVLHPVGEVSLPAFDLTGVELPESLRAPGPADGGGGSGGRGSGGGGDAVAAPDPGGRLRQITALDVDRSGRLVMVRTPAVLVVFDADPEAGGVAEALTRPGCQAPVRPEAQGETVAVRPDGRGYATLSEGVHRPLFRFETTASSSPSVLPGG